MGWRWIEPGRNGKASSMFATRAEAIRDAVTRGCGGRELSQALIDSFWAQMERGGWRVEHGSL